MRYQIIRSSPNSDWCKAIRKKTIRRDCATESLTPTYFENLDDSLPTDPVFWDRASYSDQLLEEIL